jgi:uncharacterized protein (DUF2267 family)
MNYKKFLSQIGAYTGLDEVESWEAARAVLRVIGTLLPRALRKDLKEALPTALGEVLTQASQENSFDDPDAFFSAVANSEDLPITFAREHSAVVCEALVELLSAEALKRLHSAVGPNLAPLFHHREQFRSPPRPVHEERETLSSGKPGATHPVSEAGGDTRQDTLASGQPGGAHPLNEAQPGHRASDKE